MNTIFCSQVFDSKHIFKFVTKFRAIFVLVMGLSYLTYGQEPLAGTDELGRVLPQNITPIHNKTVVMFYFLWQGTSTSRSYFDLTDITTNNPEVIENYTDPHWGNIDQGTTYFWGRPIYDYYKGDDYWVHLKNIQLLTDAGIDVLAIDATNANHYAVAVILLTTLSNTGFETPSTTTFQYGTMTYGWTFDNYSGVQHNESLWGAPPTPEGVQTAFIQRTGTISQVFKFEAGSYKISFYAAQRSGQNQTVNIYVDDNLISSITPISSNWEYYYSSEFSVTPGFHTVKFVGTTSNDNTAFIDNVCLILGGIKSAKLITETLKPNDAITLYPNPVSEILNVTFSGNNASVEIYDLNGRRVSSTVHNSSPAVIPVYGLKNGIYFAKIMNNYIVTINKFILLK